MLVYHVRDMLTLVLPLLLRNRLVVSACVPCTRYAYYGVAFTVAKQVGS